jgi:hypothetical protein
MHVKDAEKRGNIMPKGWNIVEFFVIAKNSAYKAPKSKGKLYYKLDELSICETTEEALKYFCNYLNRLEKTDEWKKQFAWGGWRWQINGDKIERYSGENLYETYYDIEFKKA